MVLSNAERQERYRRRLKAAARGEDLAERARALIDQALAVIWDLSTRPGWGDMDGFADLADFKAQIASAKFIRNNGPVVVVLREYCASWLEGDDGSPEQRDTLTRAVALLDAVSLRHVEPAEAPARPKRGRAD